MKLNRIMYRNIAFVLLMMVLAACGNSQNTGEQNFKCCENYKKIVCGSDTSINYALRLPEGFDAEKEYPLLLLFDPHGDGLFALTKFSKASEHTGFIIAASNNSKNGMPFEATNNIFKTMLSDIDKRFKINNKAIYLGGFSGGARVSAAIAFTQPGIAGVVACGAGLPNVNRTVTTPFSFLTVAGERDFNYSELKQLDAMLESGGFIHHFIVFDGKHEWPPVPVINDILLWLWFDAMRTGAVPVDRQAINQFIETTDSVANTADIWGKYSAYLKMKHYLQLLSDTSPLQAEIDKLSTDKNILSRKKAEDETNEQEKSLQQKYSIDLETRNLAWWKTEASILHKKTTSGNLMINSMYSRLLGFLSLNCYMLSNQALKQNQAEAADRYTEIYRLVDPENAEHRYIAAIISANKKEADSLCIHLNEALKLGFNDVKRMRSEAAFAPYMQSDCLKKVLVDIAAKTE